MLITIDSVIDSQQLSVIRQALENAPFVDGRLSAGKMAAQVKHNQEVNPEEQIATDLARIIMGNLYNTEVFRLATLPYRVATPIVARYAPGMHYGAHIDDPVMGAEGQRLRCDVATTVFLNQPDEYDGGELVVSTTFGEKRVKLAAGSAVVYPASSLHQVADVTRGTRLVAVTWVQSMVRDPAKREILYELGLARETLLASSAGSESCKQIDHSYTNLVRMWADI